MERLNPEKLQVIYLAGISPVKLTLPRYYTLTHSDRTGKLFLSIGNKYNTKQTSNLYTKLMRDEVLANLCNDLESLVFRVHCHVSGGFVIGTTKWRYDIFRYELRLALEAIRYGDRTLIDQNPKLDNCDVLIHFHSTNSHFNKVENWGSLLAYR
jgi:hypothetical protein